MPKPVTDSSTIRIFISILLTIFLVEGGLMIFFHFAALGNGLTIALLDALLLPILLTPALYIFAYSPLLKSNRKLANALDEIKTLKGIIPICAYCKKIRADEEIWQKLENYISDHSDAQFSHAMCPDCFEKQMAKIHS